MQTIYFPSEEDFKKWIKEAIQEHLKNDSFNQTNDPLDNGFMNRKQVAEFLNISLVTLSDWVKRGLPYSKVRGKVYFIKSEIINYVKENKKYNKVVKSLYEKPKND